MTDRAEGVGRRAALNTVARAAGELVGKLATLVVFAVLAREEGEVGVGVLTYAMAFCQVATMPVDLGLDRLLLRRIAEDPRAYERDLWTVLRIKATIAGPTAALAVLLAVALGGSRQTLLVLGIVLVAFLVESFARTATYAFMAFERGTLISVALLAQRYTAAVLGIGLLLAGHDVEGVAWGYLIGSVVLLLMSAVLLERSHGIPWMRTAPDRELVDMARRSLPFAAQDILTVALFKLDAIILGALAAEAAVGRYGGAYRLLESTFFLTIALSGAFAAPFTYLSDTTSPTVGEAFSRALKAVMVLLTPVAVAFVVVPDELCRLFFGAELESAGGALRLLGPVAVLLGLANLMTSLAASRGRQSRMVKITGAMVGVNVVLNLALVPSMDEDGAALAMLVTELLLVGLGLSLAISLVGRLPLAQIAAGPLLAAAAMAAVALLLPGPWVVALAAGGLAYVAVLLAAERVLDPQAFAWGTAAVRARLAR